MKSIIFSFFALSASFVSFSQELDATMNKLPIYGQITQSGKPAKNVKVTIYSGNEVLEEFVLKRGIFEVMLNLGNYYTIEVSAEDCLTKRLVLDTKVEKKNLKPAPFDCAIDLIPVAMIGNNDPSMLDFPVACVIYDSKRRSFEPIMEYSMNMMKLYGSVLADK